MTHGHMHSSPAAIDAAIRLLDGPQRGDIRETASNANRQRQAKVMQSARAEASAPERTKRNLAKCFLEPSCARELVGVVRQGRSPSVVKSQD